MPAPAATTEESQQKERKPIQQLAAAAVREKKDDAKSQKAPAGTKATRQEEEPDSLDNWNISLMLDTYDDIFSDFDGRHFSERAVSYDFLEECKRAARTKVEKGLEIRLMVPEKKRDAISEGLIRNRLKKNFHKNYRERLQDVGRAKKEGVSFIALGLFFLVLGGLVMSSEMSGFLVNLLLVVLEPAGWFLSWTGLDILRNIKKNFPDLDFYRKLASAEFLFFSY
ncbi:MAG: hypothetical protein V1820_05250 [archaeon]